MKLLKKIRPPFREFLAVAISNILLLWINFQLMTRRPNVGGDSPYYMEMVRGNFYSLNLMAVYRVLSPMIVRVIHLVTGLCESVSFELFNIMVLLAMAVMFYYFLKDLGFSRIYRVIGTFFLVESGTFIMYVWNPWYVDPMALLLILASVWAIIKGKTRLYILLLILSTMNKDAYGFFTLPVYYLWNLEDKQLINVKLFGKTLLLALIPAATISFLAYSGIIPNPAELPANVHYWSVRLYFTNLGEFLHQKSYINRTWSFTGFQGIPRMIYGVWNGLWMLAVLGWIVARKQYRYARMWFVMLLLLMLPLKLSPGRLTGIIFPFIIPFALWEMKFLAGRFSKISKYSMAILFLFAYRMYVTIDIRDPVQLENFTKLGIRAIGFAYCPVAIAILFAIVPILLHIIAMERKPTSEEPSGENE